MGLRGPQPTYTERVEFGLRPDQLAEVRRLTGTEYGALARWLREAVDMRLRRDGGKVAAVK